jgi:hypothetical protein
MTSKKTLMALSAALVFGVLGAASVASANDDDRGGGVSAAQAQRDWVESQRALGHTVPGNGYVENGRTAYGFAAPHAARSHVPHGRATVQGRVAAPGYYDYGYSDGHHLPARGEETYIGIQDKFYRDSN